jgi:hypothetical protein
MAKIWLLSDVVSGAVTPTEGAREEGILEAGWFTRDRLAGEIVFPLAVMERDWDGLGVESWEATCLLCRVAGL